METLYFIALYLHRFILIILNLCTEYLVFWLLREYLAWTGIPSRARSFSVFTARYLCLLQKKISLSSYFIVQKSCI